MSIPLILFLLLDRKNMDNKIMIPLIVLAVPTLFLNISYDYMDGKSVARIITCMIVFHTFASVKGNRLLFPYILFAISYVLLTQISALLNISVFASLYSFFDQMYSITDSTLEAYGTNMDSLDAAEVSLSTRFGGMYINPNNCASYLSVIYAAGLCEDYQLSGRKKPLLYVFIFLVALAFLVTGSRTALIVFFAISLYYLYSKGYGIRWFVIISLIILLIATSLNLEDIRMLKVGSGLEDSLGLKMGLFAQYLSECDNPIHFLFGAGDITLTEVWYGWGFNGTDFDLGNIFIIFGLFFYLTYFRVNIVIFQRLTKKNRVVMFVLLWVFSNSILISYRMCPVWFLTLGLFYRRSLIERKATAGEARIIL